MIEVDLWINIGRLLTDVDFSRRMKRELLGFLPKAIEYFSTILAGDQKLPSYCKKRNEKLKKMKDALLEVKS